MRQGLDRQAARAVLFAQVSVGMKMPRRMDPPMDGAAEVEVVSSLAWQELVRMPHYSCTDRNRHHMRPPWQEAAAEAGVPLVEHR